MAIDTIACETAILITYLRPQRDSCEVALRTLVGMFTNATKAYLSLRSLHELWEGFKEPHFSLGALGGPGCHVGAQEAGRRSGEDQQQRRICCKAVLAP